MTKSMSDINAIAAFLKGKTDFYSRSFYVRKDSDILMTINMDINLDPLNGRCIYIPIAKRVIRDNRRGLIVFYKNLETLRELEKTFFNGVSYRDDEFLVYAFSEDLEPDWERREFLSIAVTVLCGLDDLLGADLAYSYPIFECNAEFLNLRYAKNITKYLVDLFNDNELLLSLKPTITERVFSLSELLCHNDTINLQVVFSTFSFITNVNLFCSSNPTEREILKSLQTPALNSVSNMGLLWELYKITKLIKESKQTISEELEHWLMRCFANRYTDVSFKCPFTKYIGEQTFINIALLLSDINVSNFVKSKYIGGIYEGIRT